MRHGLAKRQPLQQVPADKKREAEAEGGGILGERALARVEVRATAAAAAKLGILVGALGDLAPAPAPPASAP